MQTNTPAYQRIERPTTREAISTLVQEAAFIEVCGGQTHGSLMPRSENVLLVDMSAYRGIIEYEPQEFVISAKAGTSIKDITSELSGQNQYLPFDPLDANPGSTLGGVVATGWSGPGSLRYGRLRDFILGVSMVPGSGQWIKGGGKVVKNAAGFDFPKLVVGSLDCFGILGEITLKVFPCPFAFMTIQSEFADFNSSLECLRRIQLPGMILDGCTLESSARLSIRIGGHAASLKQGIEKLQKLTGGTPGVLEGPEEKRIWDTFRNSGPGFGLKGRCKVPIRPSEIKEWQTFLSKVTDRFFFDQAGAVLIIDLDGEKSLRVLDEHLAQKGRCALCTDIAGGPKWIGLMPDLPFLNRIRKALDPMGKFPDFRAI